MHLLIAVSLLFLALTQCTDLGIILYIANDVVNARHSTVAQMMWNNNPLLPVSTLTNLIDLGAWKYSSEYADLSMYSSGMSNILHEGKSLLNDLPQHPSYLMQSAKGLGKVVVRGATTREQAEWSLRMWIENRLEEYSLEAIKVIKAAQRSVTEQQWSARLQLFAITQNDVKALLKDTFTAKSSSSVVEVENHWLSEGNTQADTASLVNTTPIFGPSGI
uniref:Uncharacterized protein n=1 Tax=Ditylenchus dipsaci TaxID=166011 RepID=A0A915E7S3_9BILA